jgi:hypothetical protein
MDSAAPALDERPASRLGTDAHVMGRQRGAASSTDAGRSGAAPLTEQGHLRSDLIAEDRKQTLADVVTERGRDRLRKLVARHPIDTHCLAGETMLVRASAIGVMQLPRTVNLHDAGPTNLAARLANALRIDAVRILPTVIAVRLVERPIRLKDSMPSYSQSERRAAKRDRLPQKSSGNVLDNERQSRGNELVSRRPDEVRRVEIGVPCRGERRRVLAGRRGMDSIESPKREVQRITEVEFVRLIRLRPDIDADDLKASLRVPASDAAGAAVEIEQTPPHDSTESYTAARTNLARLAGRFLARLVLRFLFALGLFP